MSCPFVANSPTSIAAAAQAEPLVQTQGELIIAFLDRQGPLGATAEEMEHGLGLGGSSLRPRLLQLRRDGLVVPAGVTRPTRSKRQAAVWALAK